MTNDDRARAERLKYHMTWTIDGLTANAVDRIAAEIASVRADERARIAAWLRDGTERTMAAEILRQVADAIEELGR